jgi:hypothetical protein
LKELSSASWLELEVEVMGVEFQLLFSTKVERELVVEGVWRKRTFDKQVRGCFGSKPGRSRGRGY